MGCHTFWPRTRGGKWGTVTSTFWKKAKRICIHLYANLSVYTSMLTSPHADQVYAGCMAYSYYLYHRESVDHHVTDGFILQ